MNRNTQESANKQISPAGRRLICGVGINDSLTPVCRRENGRVVLCDIYITWRNMIHRCYSPLCLRKRPSYAGCFVVTEWLTFSVFRAWMRQHDWKGKQLDKDILVPDNKVYSPDACVFVSHALNSFLNDHGSSRGEWPLGVTWFDRAGKFAAMCCDPFLRKRQFIGYFDCPDAAHAAWRAYKHQLASRYADTQTEPRVANALRTRFAEGGAQ